MKVLFTKREKARRGLREAQLPVVLEQRSELGPLLERESVEVVARASSGGRGNVRVRVTQQGSAPCPDAHRRANTGDPRHGRAAPFPRDPSHNVPGGGRMIHDQEPRSGWPRFYAYCSCGVVGPLRVRREDAQRDDEAHAEVCSAQVTP